MLWILGIQMADVNARLLAYLRTYYVTSETDVTTLVRRYVDEVGGDATVAMKALIAAAA